jgi:hypothetical protein
VKNLFKFIEDRYPEYPIPLKWKLLHDFDSITEKDLIVKGNLDLQGTKITQLPDNLKVEGYLYLHKTKIAQLPNNLKVGGYLDLTNTKITQLPNNLQVGGDLWLSNTPLSREYSEGEILQMIEDTGGYVERNIYM